MTPDWKKLRFYYHPIFQEHLKGTRHPENPQRLISIRKYLQEIGIWEQLIKVSPLPADRQWLETNHNSTYIESIRKACEKAPTVLDGGDTIVSSNSYEVALYAAGAAMMAVDDLMNNRALSAFCAIRPPGHHAEYAAAMGFCIFNNIAIAARYALQKYNLERIFILDWDVHHGNGTQNSFYESPLVFYCSIHQYPLYPGTGQASERGKGAGEGYTLNIPLHPGGDDGVYLRVMEDNILPAIRNFQPQLLMVSAGFDAHQEDPLASMELSTQAYRVMTQLLRWELNGQGKVKILSVLEGGYHSRHLAESVYVHIAALVEE